MSKYFVRSNKTGLMVEKFDTFDEALAAIDGYMKKDWDAGNRKLDLYNVVDEDRNVIHRYLVKITQEDGSSKYAGPIICREDYTGKDYARDHGINGSVSFEVFS